ncbi:MAG: OmpA family protein [Gemmatimonadaceae bacterium]|nr:OmpA family protein [Gemmatimonadaceae bacterium]
MIPALAALLFSSAAAAQKPGPVELGAFGQFTIMDTPWALKNGLGLGGRLGYFVTPRWELEADLSSSSLGVEAPRIGTGNKSYQTYAARVTYNLPVSGNEVLIGVGFGGETVDGGRDFSLSPALGYRWNLNNTVSLRFDGLVEYVENPADERFSFPTAPNATNKNAARSSNLELRAGLSFRLGGEGAPVAAPKPVVINQDSIDAARRRDSIAAADAARERARQDSINAAARARQDSIDAANRARAEEAARLKTALEAKIYFDFNKYDLRDDAKSALDAKIPVMQANPNVRIRIEGNTDERGSDTYNQALGMRRAEQARRYLVDKGIDAGRIDMVSNGEEKPVCTEHEESCWSQNRRDEFVIVAGGDNLMPPR